MTYGAPRPATDEYLKVHAFFPHYRVKLRRDVGRLRVALSIVQLRNPHSAVASRVRTTRHCTMTCLSFWLLSRKEVCPMCAGYVTSRAEQRVVTARIRQAEINSYMCSVLIYVVITLLLCAAGFHCCTMHLLMVRVWCRYFVTMKLFISLVYCVFICLSYWILNFSTFLCCHI